MPGKQRIEHKKVQRPRGQALVEFALLLPLLLLLILGAMDIGRMFYTKIVITNAAREGANYLAYNIDKTDEAKRAARNEANSSNVDSDSLVIITTIFTPTGGEKTVGVEVTTTVDLVFGNFLQSLGLLSGPVTLTSTVWMIAQ